MRLEKKVKFCVGIMQGCLKENKKVGEINKLLVATLKLLNLIEFRQNI